MSFSIFTDTPANLPSSIVTRYEINVIPFSYFRDGVEYTPECLDDVDFDAYYSELKGGAKITTSQINPQRYIDYVEPHMKEGRDVLYIGLSGGVTGSIASAHIASLYLMDKYPDVRFEIVDSLGASLGEGLQVLHAARQRERGMSLDETVREALRYRKRMCQVFTVDDLMHLKRSGRLSAVGAVVGTVLGIKPLLKGNEEGKIVNFTNVRGRRNAIRALVERYREYSVIPAGQTVGISHGGCLDDAIKLRDMIVEVFEPKEVIIVPHESVTGSHVGPGMLALYFEGDEKVRSRN